MVARGECLPRRLVFRHDETPVRADAQDTGTPVAEGFDFRDESRAAQALLEDVLHRPREAEQEPVGPRRPRLARGGDAPFDVYVVNAGDRDLENAKLTESSTGASLWDFAVLASRTTTHRRVYVPVTEDATFAFEVSFL